ncbi:hypothetical protein [Flavobacterium sp.]|uniref:hypothetical protein n=1 Tax=Flavobacterium sp. TaxID=239 RepID=UPI003BBBC7AF
MKLSKEITNGLIIFFGIALYFFFMKLIGLEKLIYPRFLNIFIVYYGMSRTLKANKGQNRLGFGKNLFDIIQTGLIGVVLSVVGLYVYIYYNGGQSFLDHLSQGYLTGKNPTVAEYCFAVFSEGIGSIVILAFVSMQLLKYKSSDEI